MLMMASISSSFCEAKELSDNWEQLRLEAALSCSPVREGCFRESGAVIVVYEAPSYQV